MATRSRPKQKRTPKGTITRTSRKKPTQGASVKDLVGKLILAEDPVQYQRRVRDEWG